jgi:hypothetical protein
MIIENCTYVSSGLVNCSRMTNDMDILDDITFDELLQDMLQIGNKIAYGVCRTHVQHSEPRVEKRNAARPTTRPQTRCYEGCVPRVEKKKKR